MRAVLQIAPVTPSDLTVRSLTARTVRANKQTVVCVLCFLAPAMDAAAMAALAAIVDHDSARVLEHLMEEKRGVAPAASGLPANANQNASASF